MDLCEAVDDLLYIFMYGSLKKVLYCCIISKEEEYEHESINRTFFRHTYQRK